MNLELHPEEALDRALTGELSESEQHALDQHLADCSACEAHLALARARQEACAPQPWGSRLNSLAVDCALAQFGRSRWSALLSLPARRRWMLATAGILVAAGGVASAAIWQRQAPIPDPVPAQRIEARPAARAPGPRKPALALAEPPSTLPAELPDERSSSARTLRAQPSAASLFAQASTLRDRNRVDEAITVFRKLQQLFPTTRESRLSFAVAGRMLLYRGRPAQAVAQFDQHLAQGG